MKQRNSPQGQRGHRRSSFIGASERGAVTMVIGVFLVAAVIGGYIGYSARRSQPASLPELVLGAPVERVTTQPASTTVAPLALPTTVDTVAPVDSTLPPETVPPETQPKPVANLELSSSGSAFRQGGGSRIVDGALGCDGYSATAVVGSTSSCDRLDVGGTTVVWLQNVDGDDELMVQTAAETGDEWNVAYTVAGGGKLPKVVDVTGDGQPELVYSRRDESRTLELDVFTVSSGSANLTLHLTLPEGKARADNGVLNVWLANGDGGEFLHVVLDGSSGWQKTSTAVVEESAVGIGQF
jgi:hypothetical protein